MRQFLKVAVLLAALLALSSCTQSKEWHVAKNGMASGNGSENSPFATLTQARDAIREYRKQNTKEVQQTVIIHEGNYKLNSTFKLDSQDNGTQTTPILYKASQKGKVSFTTGTIVPSDLFRPAKGIELEYLKKGMESKIIVADLKNNSIADAFTAGKGDYGLLTWNEFSMQVAQWPNRGYCHLDEVIDMGPTLRWLTSGEKSPEYSFKKPIGGKFTMVENTNFSAWKQELERTEDIYQDGYLSIDWAKDANRLARVSNDGVMQLLDPTRYGVGGVRYRGGFADPSHKPKFMDDRRLYFQNVLCELDMPGEWYFDRKDQKLYIYPIAEDYKNAQIAIPGGDLMVEFNQAKNITFEGFTFENGGNKGLSIQGGENIKIAGCTFRNFNGRAASVSGTNNGFHSCDFYNLNSAYDMQGGEYKTLTRANNYAINCDFHHLRLRGYGGVGLSGCGLIFKNNIYHDNNAGVIYSGMYIEFTNNEFYNVGWEMGDWNVLYQGATKWCNGNLVKNNFFHHFMEEPSRYPVLGARNDDGGSGTNYKSNIFYKTGRGAIAHGGPNVQIDDNIVLDCELLWWTGKAATTPRQIKECYDELAEQFESGRYPRGGKEDAIYNVEQIVGKKGWDKPLFKKAFPNFHKYMNENPFAQSYGTMLNNYSNKVDVNKPYDIVHIHANWSLLEEGEPRVSPTMENDMPKSFKYNAPQLLDIEKDFINYKSLDFRFNPEFETIEGFEACDFVNVGLFKDEYRPTPPTKETYRSALFERYKNTPSSGGKYNQKEAFLRYPIQPWMEK